MGNLLIQIVPFCPFFLLTKVRKGEELELFSLWIHFYEYIQLPVTPRSLFVSSELARLKHVPNANNDDDDDDDCDSNSPVRGAGGHLPFDDYF